MLVMCLLSIWIAMHPTCTSATNHLITSLIIADNFTCKRDFTAMFWYKPCYMRQFARSVQHPPN